MSRSIACIDDECDECRLVLCGCWCHGGEDDDFYDDEDYGDE